MRLLPRRRQLLTCLALPLTCLCLFALWYANDQRAPSYAHLRRPPPPPSHASQNENTTRYVLFDQLRGAGFNNQLQESLLLSALAARTGRAYAFHDVVWRPRGYDRVPLELFSRSLTAPPNVHESAFDQLCAGQVREVGVWPEVGERVGRAVRALEGDERCVRVRGRLMDWPFLDSDAALALYPELIAHIRAFRWSDGVLAAHARAVAKLRLGPDEPYLAIHLRRGDFKFHCPYIASTSTPYNLWARLPLLARPLPPTPSADTLLAHCWPSFGQILSTIHDAVDAHERRTGVRLKAAYVMHDAKWDAPWVWLLVRRLERALPRAPYALRFVDAAWLPLRFEEKDLGIALDMEVGRRAAVFVGNGFSSLTSNVVLMRLADGREPETIGFW